MIKEIIQSFIPWIVFFIIAGKTQQTLDTAIILAALTSIIFEFKALRKGFILSWGTFIFFIFMFISIVLFHNQWITKFSWIFSNVALAIIAWVSIFIRKPFTIQYAKAQVSPDKWQHPLFFKINYLLTAVWGLIFLINIGLHILKCYMTTYSGWIDETISFLPSIFGIFFSVWFPDWYRKKSIREN